MTKREAIVTRNNGPGEPDDFISIEFQPGYFITLRREDDEVKDIAYFTPSFAGLYVQSSAKEVVS